MKWEPSDWVKVLLMMFFVILFAFLSVFAIVLSHEGRKEYNTIEEDAKTALGLVDRASQLTSDCFQCIEAKQTKSGNPQFVETPGEFTFLPKASLHLSEDAAKRTQFPGGIQMPGVQFGLPAPGSFEYNTPVIFTRGVTTNYTFSGSTRFWNGFSIKGQPGLTSLAYVTKSTPVADRCHSLYTTTYTDKQNGIFSQAPMYILFDNAPAVSTKYYLCMCLFNLVPGAMSGTEGDYERCVPMPRTDF
jgi:hypothetical protein